MKNIVIIKISASKLFTGDCVSKDLTEVLEQIVTYHKTHQVIIVASGAIQFGRKLSNDADITLSALSAIGQVPMVLHYSEILSRFEIKTAQCLVTQANLQLPSFLKNIKQVLFELLECGYIPILNANDAVSTKELPFGDNHALTAELIPLIGATEVFIYHKAENKEKLKVYKSLEATCNLIYKAF